MKNYILSKSCFTLASLAFISQLPAADFTGDVSALYFTKDKETGVSAGFGTRTPTNHYFGAEIIYYQQTENLVGGGVSASATAKLFASGVTYKYFIPLTEQKNFHLFFGTGAGLAVANISATARAFGRTTTMSDSSANNFCYQFLTGIQFQMTDKVAAKVGWRYLNVQNVEFKTVGIPSQNLDSNAAELGLNFRF